MTDKNTRQSTIYNKVVNVDEDGEISVLEETFKYSDSFKGAVGNRFYPISKEEYESKVNDVDAIAEYLMDATELPDNYKMGGYREWAEDIVANDEGEEVFYDTSYRKLWDSIRQQVGLSEDEAYIFDCSGGGRMFDKDFQGNRNPELSAIIREFES